MLVLENVPEAADVANEVYDIMAQINPSHCQNQDAFSAATKLQTDGVISHMSNKFPHDNAIQNAKAMGYEKEDSIDLLSQAPLLPIENYQSVVDKMTKHSQDIFGLFSRAVDLYLASNNKFAKCEDQSFKEETLTETFERSEVLKYRMFHVTPTEDRTKKEAIFWHHDQGLAAILYKGRFYRNDGEGNVERDEHEHHPNEGGLLVAP